MSIKDWCFLCRLGLKNLWSNRVYATATVITMSACIFLFGIFYAAALNVNHTLQKTGEEVYVSVFFEDDVLPELIDKAGTAIRERPEVLKTVYISGDEAWSSFKENYVEDSELLDGIFEGDNPLAASGNYQVYIDGVENQQSFAAYAQGLAGVKKVVGSSDTVSALLKIKKVVSKLTLGSLGILMVISVLLIHNTLSVGIEAQKEKHHVMRLMGAQENFIKVPFIVEGFVMGILGIFIPLALLTVCYDWGLGLLTESFGSENISAWSLLPTEVIFPGFAKVSVVIGLTTGIIGSLSVLGKLKKAKKHKTLLNNFY